MENYFQKMIDSDTRIQQLYNDVKSKLEKINKKLVLLTDVSTKTGITFREKEEVVIQMNKEVSDEKAVAVFIHELGEADYISTELPYIETEWETPSSSLRRLNECFSHWHIHRLMSEYEMIDLMEDSSLVNISVCLTDNQADNLIHLLYKVCTWPDRSKEIIEDPRYKDYREDINEILSYFKTIKTIDDNGIDYNACIEEYKKIIKIVECRRNNAKVRLLSGKDGTIL